MPVDEGFCERAELPFGPFFSPGAFALRSGSKGHCHSTKKYIVELFIGDCQSARSG